MIKKLLIYNSGGGIGDSIQLFPLILSLDNFFEESEQRKWLIDRIPLGRIGSAFDIVPAIVFLASDESSFITGSEVVVDGGVVAR